MEQQRFHNWLKQQIFNDRGADCIKLILRHVTPASGKLGPEIAELDVAAEPDEGTVVELVTQLLSTAEADAAPLGGVQAYVVQSFFEGHTTTDGTLKPKSRLTFRVQTEDEDDGVSSEPPTVKGQLAQSMRHVEAVMKISTMQTANAMSMQNQMITRQAAQIEKLEEQRIRNQELVELARSKQHERDMDMMTHESKQDMLQEGIDKFAALAPIAINSLSGQKLLPVTDTRLLSVREFVSSMDTEQLQVLSQTLKPEQAILFRSILQSLEAKEPQQ